MSIRLPRGVTPVSKDQAVSPTGLVIRASFWTPQTGNRSVIHDGDRYRRVMISRRLFYSRSTFGGNAQDMPIDAPLWLGIFP
jgi:hypothetical protein